jgi:predicted aldo/keto reductase-like oxidoreductase
MNLRPFGKTGLRVSALGFGMMRLPLTDENSEHIDRPLAIKMLRRAIDAGVNYVDTAYPYHGGVSELVVGEGLRDGYRERVILETKLPTWKVETRADMDKLLDEQLKKLGVAYLDVYLAHGLGADGWNKMNGLKITEFFDAAVKDGRVKHPGFSFHDKYEAFEKIIAGYDWHVTLLQHNYLDVNAQAGQRGIKLAAERGVGVAIMEPLRGGFLTQHIPADLIAHLKTARPEWTLADWGLRWLWNNPGIGVVLSGMSSLEQVEGNLRSAAAAPDFGAKDEAALAKVQEYFKSRVKVPCTDCKYCLPCPQGCAIPRIFGAYNEYYLTDEEPLQQRARKNANNIPDAERPTKCVACKTCEPKCPQKIAIADHLHAAAELFFRAS